LGHLCQVNDGSGVAEYSYDHFGRIITQWYTIDSTTYTTHYSYNLRDDLLQTITPSDRQVDYTVNLLGQNTDINADINGSHVPLVTNIAYRADGQLSQQEFGNGFVETRLYNLKGRLTSLTLPAVNSNPNATLAANNDITTTLHFVPVNITVLNNDVYANQQDITVQVASAPKHGSATVNPDGTITYSPELHYAGNDSFQYTLTEGGVSDTAYVTVDIIDVDSDGDGIYDSHDLDSDNDGMPDTWEVANGLNYLDPSDAALDQNGDGISNLLQSQIDTDPGIVNVAWSQLVNAAVNGKTLVNTCHSDGSGRSAAFSVQAIPGDGALQFTMPLDTHTYLTTGFATENLTNDQTDISYGFNFLNGVYSVVVSGSSSGNFYYTAGDTFRLERTGGTVTYYQNGNLVYTSSVSSTGLLYADAALSSTDSQIKNAVLFGVTPEFISPVASNYSTTPNVNGDVTVHWDTDEPANSQIFYGINSTDEFSTAVDNSYVTAHAITVSGLQVNTTYQYKLVSVDAYGNSTTSAIMSFTSPSVEQVNVDWIDVHGATTDGNSLTGTAATGWNAGAVSKQAITTDGKVEFSVLGAGNSQALGLSHNYNQANANIDYAIGAYTYGRLYILEGSTTVINYLSYNDGDRFRIERVGTTVRYYQNDILIYTSSKPSTGSLIVDAAPFTTGSTIQNVVVTRNTENVPPVLSNDTVLVQSSGTVKFTWQTDEPATTGVQYGINTVGEQSSAVDVHLAQTHQTTLYDLQPNTVYQYQIVSSDTFDNQATSAIGTFTTNDNFASLVNWINPTGVSIDGNTLTKTASTAWGNSGASSAQTVTGDGGLAFTITDTTKQYILGLSTSDTSTSYNTVQFGIMLIWNGSASIYESGANVHSIGAYHIGDRFRIERTGETISYYRNDQLLYTSQKTSTGSLVADLGIYLTGTKVSDVVIYGKALNTAANEVTPRPQFAAFNSQAAIAIVANPSASGRQDQYVVWRKGPATQHQWVQTAEDPNAYDRPKQILYLSADKFDEWRAHDHRQLALDTGPLMRALLRTSTSHHDNAFLPVSSGGGVTVDTEVRNYSYDGVGNLQTLTENLGVRTYQYDHLSRLLSAQSPDKPLSAYTYDRNGNRTTQTKGSMTTTNTLQAASNHYTSQADSGVSYDTAGNITSTANGQRTYTYNQEGRLFQVYDAGTLVASYSYNAFGQRVKKVTPTESIIYHYDLSGKLLGETSTTGGTSRDYIYNGSIPVAQVSRQGTQDNLVYLHTDQLGTPRRATDTSGQVVWLWRSEPFGDSAANDDPDQDGTSVTVNLRFPGQYYDQETGLQYNYFRYYDPSTGRYITSDPIGLRGGLNTYGYVGGNPVLFADPLGLWSTGAHNFFIDSHFQNIDGIDLQNMKNGSAHADSLQYQTAEYAYMHAMGDGVHSNAEQCRKMNEFIKEKMADYKKALALSNSAPNEPLRRAYRARAFYSLGMALHPAMDSTSPAHEGWQVWHWDKETVTRHGDFSTSLEDIWAAQDPDSFMKTMNAMDEVMKGNAVGCGCN
jgi:RHS repeat-associated protein